MDVRKTRRNNLAALLATRGARKALAEAVDSDPAYLSQLLSPRIKADMGHDLARRIERALGKPPGWMDQPHRRRAAGQPHSGPAVATPEKS
jgi:hypothetical protein